MITWVTFFNDLDTCFKNKNYERAEMLIAEGRKSAYELFSDPRFIMQELRDQEKKLKSLLRTVPRP